MRFLATFGVCPKVAPKSQNLFFSKNLFFNQKKIFMYIFLFVTVIINIFKNAVCRICFMIDICMREEDKNEIGLRS